MQDAIVFRHIALVATALIISAQPAFATRSSRRATFERPTCGSDDKPQQYNTPLHVFALFLILILSTIACSFPILVRKVPRLPVPHHALFLSRHFGTGVLIATAFVHLLPTAYTSLTDPCLPPFWTDGYPAMAGFIAMVSVMVVVGVEMFFATKGAGHSHASDYGAVGQHNRTGSGSRGGQTSHARPPNNRADSLRRFKQGHIGPGGESQERLTGDDNGGWSQGSNGHSIPLVARKGRTSQDEDDDNSDLDLDELDPQADRSRFLDDDASNNEEEPVNSYTGNAAEAGGTPASITERQQAQKALLQCLLLEAGILFHSVFIGMALSVATGTSFIVLLIAISFHQTFEGLALGSRIAAITAFPKGSPKPWLMALAYGTTTPVGQAIGLAVHNLYDPASQMGLLMVGVMNAISSGLLLFAGLVELLAEDFLSDHSYEILKGARRLEACASVVAGSMLMALVGAWA